MKSIVVIVAKAPVPSCVKTRLCPHLTETEAAELYTLFVQDMIEEISHLNRPAPAQASSTVALAYSPDGSEPVFRAILPEDMPLFPQRGADLGERLAGIFQTLHAQGYDQVHVVNSDSPDMPCTLVDRSIQLLRKPHIDMVLGPSLDGGYYLIGLKRPAPRLFSQIPWSTERVLEKTIGRARELGLRFALLEPWYDIDHYDDLLLFLERNRNATDDLRRAGWRTLSYLRRGKFGPSVRTDPAWERTK